MQSFPLSQIPVISGAEAVKALKRADWTVVRQSGSHLHMTKSGHVLIVTIPQFNVMGRLPNTL